MWLCSEINYTQFNKRFYETNKFSAENCLCGFSQNTRETFLASFLLDKFLEEVCSFMLFWFVGSFFDSLLEMISYFLNCSDLLFSLPAFGANFSFFLSKTDCFCIISRRVTGGTLNAHWIYCTSGLYPPPLSHFPPHNAVFLYQYHISKHKGHTNSGADVEYMKHN